MSVPNSVRVTAHSPQSAIDRARAGSPDALGELYAQHGAGVFAVAMRLAGSREDAEDVLHDTFVGLPEALRRYEERGQFPEWIRRVAARLALSRRRSNERKREVSIDDMSGHPALSHSAEQSDVSAVELAVSALPQSLRDVFVLKEIEGFSHRDIAALLGISEGASAVRHCRAVRQLRTMLRKEDL